MRRLLALGACVVLVGCGAPGEVQPGQLEEQVSSQLTEVVGQAPDSVECPDPLPAEVGAEVRCTLAGGGEEYGVTVTAQEIEADTVEINIRVDEQPLP
jgi:hypothetical protein